MDPEKVNYHYCDDLPTKPLPGNLKVLVTGANGYIARRLIPELVHRGYFVRCMVRNKHFQPLLSHPRIEFVYADCLDQDELNLAMEGINTAYYLIHSMRLKKNEFHATDKKAAENFVAVAEARGIKKIIYLGGLGETGKKLSPHLQSRMEVGAILAKSSIPVIRLRAAIIIGTGSASYELLKSLVLHNRWIPFLPEFNSKCQPIAIRDVIKYLVGILETEGLTTRVYPIGGRDVLTYKELVTKFADCFDKKIKYFDVSWCPLPVSAMCNIYAFWLHLFISIPVNITSLLLGSLGTSVVCESGDIAKILPFQTLDFDTALKWAHEREKKSEVFSHWTDVPPEHMADQLPLCEYESADFVREEHSVDIPAKQETVFNVICRIGGDRGWQHANFLWQVRGFIDRLLGGIGLSRGRRDPDRLRVGDSVDFWRVEKYDPGKELLLRAELISPGLSWLQFELNSTPDGSSKLTLRAHFIPWPVWGHLYWFVMSGFHTYIFKGMLKFFYKESVRSAGQELKA